MLRSIGERGEAGEASNERPTGPIGEQGTPLLLPEERYLCVNGGDCGGKIAALRRSLGVTGERKCVCWRSGDCGLNTPLLFDPPGVRLLCVDEDNGEDFKASGEGKGTWRADDA